jgi:hypothetical protein
MGWLYPSGYTLKQLIAERSQDWETTLQDGTHVSTERKARCFKGNPAYAGVLWIVWEKRITPLNGTVKTSRFISCDLLRCTSGEWGYKHLNESDGPLHYHCPLGYLREVPEVQNEEWRDAVRKYHADVAKRRKLKEVAQQEGNECPDRLFKVGNSVRVLPTAHGSHNLRGTVTVIHDDGLSYEVDLGERKDVFCWDELLEVI